MSEKLFVPPHRYIFTIPLNIRRRICLCDEPTWMENAPCTWVKFCGRCEKPLRYLVEKCIGPNGCGTYYIRDFLHDGRCVLPKCQLCWDCFQKLGKQCDHTHRGPNWKPIICEPFGLNPRKFTSEELANAFEVPDFTF